MLIQILSMILRFLVAKDIVGMNLLTVVPAIPVIRLTFQEQPPAFVLTLPDASKPQPPPLRWVCSDSRREAIALTEESGPDSPWRVPFALCPYGRVTAWNELLCIAHGSCAYCIHEGASYLLSILEGFELNP